MRIAVTGGTGFVGSHAVVALVHAGHDVRLLVRDPARVSSTFSAHNIETPTDLVAGDVTDPAAIRQLLAGCDAVLHAASVFSLDPRRAKEMRTTNAAGTELVLSHASATGLDPIVHISSVVTFMPGRGQTVGPDSPVGTGVDPYSRSKIESELIARRLQANGAPVVSIMPGAVSGPDDPYFGEIQANAAYILRGLQPFLPRGGRFETVDVRDLAQTIAATFRPSLGPRAYTVAGPGASMIELARLLGRITGRRIIALPVPDRLALASGWLADRMQPLLPWTLPIRGSTVREITNFPFVDSSRARTELGFSSRTLEESVADTVRSMLANGRITPGQAGSLAQM